MWCTCPALSASDRFHVFRSVPAWLKDGAPDGQLAQLDQIGTGLLDLTNLIGTANCLRRSCMDPIVRIGDLDVVQARATTITHSPGIACVALLRCCTDADRSGSRLVRPGN